MNSSLYFYIVSQKELIMKKTLFIYGCLKFNFLSLIGAIAIAPYGFFKNQKHYNLTYFSQKLFFNVKITLSKIWSEL